MKRPHKNRGNTKKPSKKPITYGLDLEYKQRHSSEQALLTMIYLEEGLIPPGVNIQEALKQMSPREARKTKRKFRKVFRKFKKTVDPDGADLHWGEPHCAPQKYQKLRRRLFVEANFIMGLTGPVYGKVSS